MELTCSDDKTLPKDPALMLNSLERALACLQDKTEVDVGEYKDQFANYNTRIELSREEVNYKEISVIEKCEVTVQMTADRDYELFTELQYKSADE